MKTLNVILLALVLNNTRMLAQENVHELTFENYSASRTVLFRIFPVSMVFNGFNDLQQIGFQYNLLAMNPSISPNNPWKYNYINGGNDSIESYYLADSTYVGLNQNRYGTLGGSYACVGYGIYKVFIQWDSGFDTCTVEWDAGYPYVNPPVGWSSDLSIIFRDDSGNPRVLFDWGGSLNETSISDVGNKIVAWDQQYDSQNRRRIRDKQFGSFIYDSSANNPYSELPLDCRSDCGNENQSTDDSKRSGLLTLNLTISKNIFTRDTLIDFPTGIIIGKHAAMKIAANRTFEMITPTNAGDSTYTDLVIGDSAFLILYGGSSLIVDWPNRITLNYGSNLTLAQYSEITIKNGARFCNGGGNIRGPGHIVFEKGIHDTCEFDNFTASDSTRIVFDSATVSFPDNFTLHLKGDQTALVVNPGSKLLFCKNSGIVCDSGARSCLELVERSFQTT